MTLERFIYGAMTLECELVAGASIAILLGWWGR